MNGPLLVASDFSEAARRAVERAAQLAEALGVPADVQHVVDHGALERLAELLLGRQPGLRQRLLDDAREELAALCAQVGSRRLASHLAEGEVIEQILARADALDARLLVVGTTGAGHSRLGATTERLMQSCARPLLAVRQPASGAYRRVLVPVDFSARARPTLEAARALAPEAQLVLLHAYEIPFEQRLQRAGLGDEARAALLLDLQARAAERLARLAADAGLDALRTERILLHGDPGRRILEQQPARQCDLVVLGKRRLGRAEAWLLGSVTQHVLAHADCDVLVLPLTAD